MSSTKKVQTAYLIPEKDCRGYCEPVLVSACFLGIPCRWHGRRAKRRDALLERLKRKYVLVPLCPEQLGGMPTRVHGRCETLIHDIEVEDQAAAMLEYDNGATGYFYVSTCEVGPRIVEIVGDKGKLRLDGAKLSFCRFGAGVMAFNEENTAMWGKPGTEQVELDIEEVEHGHGVVIRNFARAILFGEERVTPGEVGLKSLELANAIILSSYKGEPVDLPVDREAYEELIESLKADSKFRGDWDQSKSETDPQFKK